MAALSTSTSSCLSSCRVRQYYHHQPLGVVTSRMQHSIHSKPSPTSQQTPLLSLASASTPLHSLQARSRLVGTQAASNKVQRKPTITSWGKGSKGTPPSDPQPDEDNWGLFNLKRYQEPWDAPWGPARAAGGLALWFLSFVAVGFLVVPLGYKIVGVDIGSLNAEGRAQFTFVCQVVETAATLLLIWSLTNKKLEESQAPDFFNVSLAQPFRKPKGWALWALLGTLASPLVVGGVATLLSTVGYDSAVGGNGTVDGVASMIDLDLPTYLYLLSTTGVLAPILEETVFRGFLLASMTKFMPTWAAVVASSVTFGIAHLSLRDLPVLSALGMLLGFSYVRSKNLLTPMIIHGVWNSTVLTLLFFLTASGVDVQQMIQEVRSAS